jgi:hypothetical protein
MNKLRKNLSLNKQVSYMLKYAHIIKDFLKIHKNKMKKLNN